MGYKVIATGKEAWSKSYSLGLCENPMSETPKYPEHANFWGKDSTVVFNANPDGSKSPYPAPKRSFSNKYYGNYYMYIIAYNGVYGQTIGLSINGDTLLNNRSSYYNGNTQVNSQYACADLFLLEVSDSITLQYTGETKEISNGNIWNVHVVAKDKLVEFNINLNGVITRSKAISINDNGLIKPVKKIFINDKGIIK